MSASSGHQTIAVLRVLAGGRGQHTAGRSATIPGYPSRKLPPREERNRRHPVTGFARLETLLGLTEITGRQPRDVEGGQPGHN